MEAGAAPVRREEDASTSLQESEEEFEDTLETIEEEEVHIHVRMCTCTCMCMCVDPHLIIQTPRAPPLFIISKVFVHVKHHT